MKVCRFTTTTVIAGLACLLSAGAARAAQGTTTGDQRGQLSAKDYKFVEEASRSGMSEVEMGRLAQQKGASQAVRNFGERMVADHNRNDQQLKDIVTRKGATLPASLSHHEHSTMAHLQNLTGAEFDRAYAKDMVKDHRKDLKEFEKAAKDVNDPDLRGYAQNTIQTLQEHLRLAEQMEASVKNER